jgi:hypothetical protein
MYLYAALRLGVGRTGFVESLPCHSQCQCAREARSVENSGGESSEIIPDICLLEEK